MVRAGTCAIWRADRIFHVPMEIEVKHGAVQQERAREVANRELFLCLVSSPVRWWEITEHRSLTIRSGTIGVVMLNVVASRTNCVSSGWDWYHWRSCEERLNTSSASSCGCAYAFFGV